MENKGKCTLIRILSITLIFISPTLLAAAKTTPLNKLIKLNTNNVDVRLYGQLNQGIMYTRDGHESNTFFVSNAASLPRLGTIATYKVNSKIKTGGVAEVGLLANSSDTVSQANHNPADSVDLRKAEVFVTSKKWGTALLGKGDTASNGSSEVDLSGTTLAGYASVSDLGGGLFFYDKNTRGISTVTIGNSFSDMNLHLRESRIRYQTPTFHNFSASVSKMAGNQQDLSLWYNNKFKYAQVAGAFGWLSPQDISSDSHLARGHVVNGSVSALLTRDLPGFINSKGASLTIATGRLHSGSGRNDPNFWYTKLGYQRNWFKLGTTALSVDYGRYNDFARNRDEGKTVGLDAVQNIKKWNLSVYAGGRRFKLDRTSERFDHMYTYVAGVLFQF